MEPVKGGGLAKVPQAARDLMEARRPGAGPASWALRFAASQPGVSMVLSGMGDLEQIQENASLMRNFEPLDEDEYQTLWRCADIVLPIPRYFALFNENKRDGWQANAKKRYQELTQIHAPAAACVGCRQCETKCPQHLAVADFMSQVSSQFDSTSREIPAKESVRPFLP